MAALTLPSVALAIPQMVADPTGKFPIKYPKGWTTKTHSENGVHIVGAAQQANSQTSPSIGMVSMPKKLGTADAMMKNFLKAIPQYQIVVRVPIGRNHYGMEVKGQMLGVNMRAVAVTSESKDRVFAAFFVAKTNDFYNLGGHKLLYASLGWPLPKRWSTGAAEATAPQRPVATLAPTAGLINIRGYQEQMRVLQSPAPATSASIVGRWSTAGGYQTNNVYRNVESGALSWDSFGQGSFFELRADGTYDYIYRYDSRVGTCSGKVKRLETGRYSFDGKTLTLSPKKLHGTICSCCTASRQPTKFKKRGNKRSYTIAFTPGHRQLVMRGHCPKMNLSCVGPTNNKFLREGFTRQP